MATKEDFNKLEKLFTAINDINRAIQRNSDDIIDEVLNFVKDIDKKDYPEEFQEVIVTSIRSSLIDLYQKQLAMINNNIGISINKLDIENKEFGPKTSTSNLSEKEVKDHSSSIIQNTLDSIGDTII